MEFPEGWGPQVDTFFYFRHSTTFWAPTIGTVRPTTGKVGEALQDDGMVAKDSAPDSGYSKEQYYENKDEDDAEDDNFQLVDDKEIV